MTTREYRELRARIKHDEACMEVQHVLDELYPKEEYKVTLEMAEALVEVIKKRDAFEQLLALCE